MVTIINKYGNLDLSKYFESWHKFCFKIPVDNKSIPHTDLQNALRKLKGMIYIHLFNLTHAMT